MLHQIRVGGAHLLRAGVFAGDVAIVRGGNHAAAMEAAFQNEDSVVVGW
jgi:hypothetical protein